MFVFDEDDIFCFSGVINVGEYSSPAVGLPQNFFYVSNEQRKKCLNAWIELLQGCLDDEFFDSLSNEVNAGEMAVIVSSEVVELREIPDNIIHFKRDD